MVPWTSTQGGDQVGWELDGYVVGPELGRDAAGTIVMARDVPTGTDVAIRFLSAALCASTEFMWRFRADVVQLEAIEAANVAEVYELIERDGQVAVVTELVDGLSLRDVLRRGVLPPDAALYVMAGVLTGLAAVHSRDVLHRALSAETVLVEPNGVIKLVDVGLAGPGAPTVNAAPELRDGGPASIAADVYAAYVVLLECVAGVRYPHDGAGIPSWLQVAISVGLAERPEARYPDAGTALYQLQLVASGALGPDWYAAGRESLLRRVTEAVAPPVGPAVLPAPVSPAVPAIPVHPRSPRIVSPVPPAVRPRTPAAALPAWVERAEPSPWSCAAAGGSGPGPVGTATRGTFAAARGRGRGPGVDRQWHRVGPRVRAERGARRVGRGDHQLPRADGRHARSDRAGDRGPGRQCGHDGPGRAGRPARDRSLCRRASPSTGRRR